MTDTELVTRATELEQDILNIIRYSDTPFFEDVLYEYEKCVGELWRSGSDYPAQKTIEFTESIEKVDSKNEVSWDEAYEYVAMLMMLGALLN